MIVLGGTPQPKEVSNSKNKGRNGKPVESDDCDDEYMLQNLHKLKRFIRRVWSYAWCYTQYCYPGFRTAEYYKKVKRVCQEREKVDKEKKKKEKKRKNKDDKKDDKKKLENTCPQIEPTNLSSGVASSYFLSDSSTQTSDDERSDIDDLDDDDHTHDSRPKAEPLKNLVKPLNILPALEEELGWGEFAVKRFRQLSWTISNFIITDQEYRISAVVKVVCLLLAPAVIWLGVNYVFLKRKYKSLSGERLVKMYPYILYPCICYPFWGPCCVRSWGHLCFARLKMTVMQKSLGKFFLNINLKRI